MKLDVVCLAIELIFLRHGELLGRDEVKHGVEMAHGGDEGVDGAAVFQIAHEIDVEVLQRTLCLVDRVEVEQAL